MGLVYGLLILGLMEYSSVVATTRLLAISHGISIPYVVLAVPVMMV